MERETGGVRTERTAHVERPERGPLVAVALPPERAAAVLVDQPVPGGHVEAVRRRDGLHGMDAPVEVERLVPRVLEAVRDVRAGEPRSIRSRRIQRAGVIGVTMVSASSTRPGPASTIS